MAKRRISSRMLRPLAAGLLTLGLTAGAALGEEGGSEFYFGDPGQAVISVLIFLGLLFVLGKWAWKPLVGQLERREKSIAETIEQAQKRQAQAEELLAQYKAQLDSAQEKAQELLNQSRKDAAEAREVVLAAAQKEAQKAGELARQDVERAKRDALNELYDTTARLATDIAENVLRKNITPEDHQRLMSDSLAEVRQRVSR